MKDIVKEAAVLNKDFIAPGGGEIQCLVVEAPEEQKILFIFKDIFDFVFRFIATILFEFHLYSVYYFFASHQDHPPQMRGTRFALSCTVQNI